MGAEPGHQATRTAAACHTRGVERALDLADLHEQYPSRYPHLLQSTAHGRFDILFACPGDTLSLDARGLHGPHAAAAGFLAAFDDWHATLYRPGPAHAALPFTGGWFVYLGYELAGEVEPTLVLPGPGGTLPVALATRFPCAVIRDHRRGTTTIVAEPGHAGRLAEITADIAAAPAPGQAVDRAPVLEAVREAPPADYLDAVRRTLEYIHEGDVFQANLSRAWTVSAGEAVGATALYRRLRRHNPSPYSGIARLGTASLVSSSPERLVRVRDGRVETRPIAGTRPRGADAAGDAAFSRELLAHPKERAEHIMLIDLERNDLGRICRPGSIAVDEFMQLESYAHVHHIVSNIRGRLRDEVTPGAVLRAVFPGGTITGCPKVRCMEIIAELEREPREAYTGSMGYVNRDGSMDMNILIRSMLVAGDTVRLRAGAGIVADSVPARELEETRAKARGLLSALGAGAG